MPIIANGSNQGIKLINKPNYKNTLKNIIFFSGGIILFIVGVIGYGVILNLRTVTLAESMIEKGIKTFKNPRIIIDRESYTLSLYEDTLLIKTYRASFGPNVKERKKKVGDLATPIGEYEICDIDTSYLYDKFLRLNYPNIEDITEALRKGLITQTEFDRLKYQFYYEGCPTLDTVLGNNIGIQGTGRLNFLLKNLPFVYNWTNGCIAISNEGIDELYSIVKKGTKIVIK
ncbi:MAG TPA: L,D-transpeptidase [Ignavibacteriaceae bacterium]|nr:L,D-transpeptidase [Ignavibacteriaceae bacterium]